MLDDLVSADAGELSESCLHLSKASSKRAKVIDWITELVGGSAPGDVHCVDCSG